MRKTGWILVATIIMLSATACSGKEVQNDAKSVSLYKKGLEMTVEMDTLAESEEFAKLFTSDTAIAKTIADIGSQDYEKPKAVYEITGIEEEAFKYLLSETDIKLDEKIQEYVKERFGAAVASLLNGANGVEFIAATSILTVEDSFLYKGLEEQKTYLFLYDGNYSGMVTFIPQENGVVAATANIVMQESLKNIQSAEDVAPFFENLMEFSELKVTEIKE